MNIGDQVRVLHGSEEGFITRIIDEKTIEIEIEDGFTIPVLKKDVVLVKREESEFFDQNQKSQIEDRVIKKTSTHTGVYIAFIPSSENFVDLYFINNTNYNILITAHSITKGSVKGVFFDKIHPKSHIIVGKWNIKHFEQWNDLLIDVLYFQSQSTAYRPPLSKKVKFQAKSFFNNFRHAPLVEQKGYLYQIDENTKKIAPTMLQSISPQEIHEIDIPEDIIDLHADQLTKTQKMPSHEILNYQLEVFKQKLDAAIATGMSEITFVHGNGNGTLKLNIHKHLSQHPYVAFYKDAQKNKFGYGATYVKIK